jgi:hypothetical protein|tara:strand:+ start:1608 stop:1829 length:222 start_codon:yes stop_codon:yes gene_type:complete
MSEGNEKIKIGDIVIFKDENIIELGPGLVIEGPVDLKTSGERIQMTFTVPAVKVRWANGESSWVGVKWLIKLN